MAENRYQNLYSCCDITSHRKNYQSTAAWCQSFNDSMPTTIYHIFGLMELVFKYKCKCSTMTYFPEGQRSNLLLNIAQLSWKTLIYDKNDFILNVSQAGCHGNHRYRGLKFCVIIPGAMYYHFMIQSHFWKKMTLSILLSDTASYIYCLIF